MKSVAVTVAATALVLLVALATVGAGRTAWANPADGSANGIITFPCRFAGEFEPKSLASGNLTLIEAYTYAVLQWEHQFHTQGISYAACGLTYDGHPISQTTGLPTAAGPHPFSAPSKEALHVALLAKALAGHQRALEFVCGSPMAGRVGKAPPDECANLVANILLKKVAAYRAFNASYPGFGGFLPWFGVNNTGAFLLDGWTHTVPGLDNGEWLWALTAAQVAANITHRHSLAQGLQRQIETMKRNALMIFWNGDAGNATLGQIRAVANISDPKAEPERALYANAVPDYWLDDPYEGEMMAVFMYLFGDWAGSSSFVANVTAARDALWTYKRTKLKSATLETTAGNITTQRGWWFSAHEQWKYLELPYTDSDINRRVFINGERARSWNSAVLEIPGMYASVNDVTVNGTVPPDYISATGIQSLAFEQVTEREVVTPYSVFPMVLAAHAQNTTDAINEVMGVALAWHNTIIRGIRMQGPLGTTEAVSLKNNAIAPLVTWDAKATTILALCEGVANMTRAYLVQEGAYDDFLAVVDREWGRVFGPTGTNPLQGEALGFRPPTAALPPRPARPQFTHCNATSSR